MKNITHEEKISCVLINHPSQKKTKSVLLHLIGRSSITSCCGLLQLTYGEKPLTKLKSNVKKKTVILLPSNDFVFPISGWQHISDRQIR